MGFVPFRAIKTKTQSLDQPVSGEICPKTLFFKDKTHKNKGKYDIFQIFWYTMLESTVSKKKFKILLKNF